MARSLPSLNTESALWAQIERSRVAREQTIASTGPRTAIGLTAMQRAYPYMPADAKLALAKSGRSTTDPITGVVAAGSIKRRAKKGFGWHSLGDAVQAGLSIPRGAISMLGDFVSPAAEAVTDVARPVIRAGFMGLMAPLEEAQGLLRNVTTGLPGKLGEMTAGTAAGAGVGATLGALGGPFAPITATAGAIGGAIVGGLAGLIGPEAQGRPEWAPSSQLGIAAGHVLSGEDPGTGSGFFVGHKTKLYEEQRARAIRQAKIAGTDQGWTIGRSVADVVLEPGTTPYNLVSGLIDARAAVKLDPAFLAMAKRSQITAARRTLDPVKAAELKLTDGYRTLTEQIAAQPSATAVRRMFNGQLDSRPDVLHALATTDDADDIARILDAPDLLGTRVTTMPTAAVRKKVTTRLAVTEEGLTRRPLVNVPREAIDWSDPKGAMDKLDAWMAIGRVDKTTRTRINDQFIAALAEGVPASRLPPLEAAAQAVEEVVKGRLGAAKAQALLDEAAQGLVPHSADAVAAAEKKVADATEIGRRVTKLFTQTHTDARHYSAMAVAEGSDIPGVAVAGDRMSLTSPHLYSEFLTQKTYLPDSDEIARFTGFAARAYKHPLVPNSVNALDRAMGVWRRTVVLRPAYIPRTIGEAQARMAASGYDSLFRHPVDFIARMVAHKKGEVLALTDEPLKDMDAVVGGLNRMSGTGALADTKIALSDRARLTIADGADEFYAGWKNHEISHIATDPVAHTIMREVMRVPAGGGPATTLDDIKEAFWSGRLSGIRKDLSRYVDDELHLADRASADSYIDSIVERVEQFTRNDADILDYAIAFGRDKAADPAAARAAMERLVGEGNAPPLVVGQRFGGRLSPDQKGLFDQVTDVAFDHLAVRPENFFVRHQILGQSYWNAVERMLPAMDDTERAATLALARRSKLPPDQISRLEGRAATAFDGPRLTRDDVHQIAAFESVDTVKKMLYDFSSKKQWGNATRLVFPFADVWAEMLKTWGSIVTTNPAVLRRGQQVVEGARGSGFFTTDENGEETFVYPGSAFVTRHLVGAPIPLKASASGLNLFASNPIMPGFGPLAQWGASTFLPDKPEFDWAQELVSPYGDIAQRGAISAVLPPWARRLRSFMTSGEGDRVFNNTVGDMAAYLVTSQGYAISTVEEQEATTEAAVSMAKRMYLLRAFAQSGLPAAPQPVPVADVDGRIVTQQKLVDEFRALQKDPEEGGVGYEAAPAEFLSRYGEEALLFMQPKSRGGAPPLEDTMDWVRSHPDLVKRYKTTYGYFAPHAGEFSMTAYERQIATGERDALTPIERYQLANSRVAQMRLRQVKDQIGPKPSKAQRAWLTRFSEALADTYQGYEPQAFDPARTPRMVRELERAVEEPALRDTPAGKAIAKYMAARAQASEVSRTRLGLTSGVPFAKAKKAAPVRAWLRAVADAIIDENPEFAVVWDQVLSHELTADDFEQPEPPVPPLVTAGVVPEEEPQ